MTNSENSSRIARNTMLLYFRMLILMIISLFTSRIVIKVLGLQDFGIYNVVGGVIVVLGFVSGTLSTASARFITVALSSGILEKMKKTFSSILLVNLSLCILVIIVSETVGLWFLNYKLKIPTDRLNVAFWVYQISVLTIVLNIITVPFNAVIIAHEKMSAFAYISILDGILKIISVSLLFFAPYDKLLIYSILILSVQLIDNLIYLFYCFRKFEECKKFKFSLDTALLKDIFQFLGWSVYGSVVSVGFTEGLNIVLNVTFGPVINAARGISVQVQNAVMGFTSNFQTAINPQIIKSYVQQDFTYVQTLLIASTKYSLFILFLLSAPIIIETHYILNIWLGIVPNHTVWFIRLMLVISIFNSMANPLRIVNQANGNIKKFQLYECTILLMIVPLAWIGLKFIKIAELAFIVHLFLELSAQVVRVKIVLPKIKMQVWVYIKETYFRFLSIALVSIIIPITIYQSMDESFLRFFYVSCTSILTTVFSIYLFGLGIKEKQTVKIKISKLISKKTAI